MIAFVVPGVSSWWRSCNNALMPCRRQLPPPFKGSGSGTMVKWILQKQAEDAQKAKAGAAERAEVAPKKPHPSVFATGNAWNTGRLKPAAAAAAASHQATPKVGGASTQADVPSEAKEKVGATVEPTAQPTNDDVPADSENSNATSAVVPKKPAWGDASVSAAIVGGARNNASRPTPQQKPSVPPPQKQQQQQEQKLPNSKETRNVVCAKCGKKGHIAAECRGARKAGGRDRNRGKGSNDRPLTCKNCGRKGHKAAECRSKARARDGRSGQKRDVKSKAAPKSSAKTDGANVSRTGTSAPAKGAPKKAPGNAWAGGGFAALLSDSDSDAE